MTTIEAYLAEQDWAADRAHANEAHQRPTREERAELLRLADRGEARALAAADWWTQVRAAVLKGDPMPPAPEGVRL